MRRLVVLVVLAVLAPPAVQAASVDDACWYRDVDQLDATTDPPQGGDSQFFTSSQVSPNLIWVLDDSGSMTELPCSTGSGCGDYSLCNGGFSGLGNPIFTDMGYKGYTTDAAAYDAFDPDYCSTPGDPRTFSGTDGCYLPGVVYRSPGCGWSASGNVWKMDGATASDASIPNWCASHFTSTNYPPNPAVTPATCQTDADCPTGYACQDPTGSSGVFGCYLPVIDCTTASYTCPTGYTCDTTTKKCTNSSAVVTPPNPYQPFTRCTSTSCPTGYQCSRSDGSTWGWHWAFRCYLQYSSPKYRFPYSSCTASGYTCPTGYSCDATSGACEKTVVQTAPLQDGTATCTSNAGCATGYVCTTDAGGTVGSNLHCRLPLAPCTTSGYICPDVLQYTCSPTDQICESSAVAQCVTNLETYGYESTGWFNTPVFTGDLLNFYPPKFVVARKVLKDLVPQVKNTRQALMTYGSSGWGKVLTDLGPTCDQYQNAQGQPVLPPASDYTTQAQAIINQVNGMSFNGYTPLAGTLTTAAQYLTSDYSRFYNQVMVHSTVGVHGGDSALPTRSGADDSMCWSCQQNFIVLITDGEPDGDTAVPSELRTYGGLDPTYVDDVANFANHEDLRPDISGFQDATVDTVGFGIHSQTLEDTAALGGGIALAADNASQLENALATVVADVNTRATSFSVASITTVETRGSDYAFVPRFSPSKDKLWEGHLYRFNVFNEFAEGCTQADTIPPMTPAKLAVNPNGDGSCNDVYLQDANGNFIEEDPNGNYMVADTSQPWNATTGWPLKIPLTPATPVWDAADQLENRNQTTDPRNISTVTDTNGDGVLNSADGSTPFDVAHVATLEPYLALGGASSDACNAIAQKLGMAGSFTTEQDCATALIDFVRGLDVFDENKNGSTTDPRPKILGDIFHSSPVLVTAPTPQYLCDLGVTTQCLFSLYGSQLTPNGVTAYDAYAKAQENRPQFVLVGANDGMIHAFDAGTWSGGVLSKGTGRELWAFIPPDVLPKLKRMFIPDGRHELYIDGTAMVRDIWVDGGTASGDQAGQKDADEFHTMAVVGERQGGRNWIGLDVTDPTTPVFRWEWPPPGSTEALEEGESWDDFAPSAPPIGPVAVASPTGPLTVDGKKAREDWAVFLNGGYDPSLMRGSALDVLDVWTGAPLWRFDRTSPNGATLGPVAAPISLLDLGASGISQGGQDGLFDTAVFPDIFGNVWTARFYDPADLSSGVASNWFAARAFVQHKAASLSERNPFFQMAQASVAPDSGEVRTYVGSGDRANIRDLDGGECALNNLTACIRKGCTVTTNPNRDDQGPHYVENTWQYTSGGTSLGSVVYQTDAAAASTVCTDPTSANTQVSVQCTDATGTPLSATWSDSLSCGWDPSSGALCSTEVDKPDPFYSTLNFAGTTTNATFYAFRLFDSTRTAALFDNATDAATYDSDALTDTDLGDADTTPATGTTDPDGYFISYLDQNERSSSAATVLGGCVYWNTLEPNPAPNACGAQVADTARMYHADYATGSLTCGSITQGSPRSVSRTAIVPPQPPTPVVAVNPSTGEVHYSMVSVEPGTLPSQQTVGAGQLAGTVYWLDVPREVHQCRHTTTVGACSP